MELDLNAIQAELNQELATMTEEDLRAALIEHKTRQRVASKKYYNPETAKRARQKKAALLRLMQERAEELGILDEINEAAGAQADARLAAEED